MPLRPLVIADLLRAWLLATLLLAAHAAGLAHRIAHAPTLPPGLVAASAAASDASGHAPGSAECRLVDQLTHADALCGGAVVAALPALAADSVPRPAAAGHIGAAAAAYLVRAPPAQG